MYQKPKVYLPSEYFAEIELDNNKANGHMGLYTAGGSATLYWNCAYVKVIMSRS